MSRVLVGRDCRGSDCVFPFETNAEVHADCAPQDMLKEAHSGTIDKGELRPHW